MSSCRPPRVAKGWASLSRERLGSERGGGRVSFNEGLGFRGLRFKVSLCEGLGCRGLGFRVSVNEGLAFGGLGLRGLGFRV